MDAEEAILALKNKFKVSSDLGLANCLKLGRSTITSWKRRGSVPDRYLRLINPDSDAPFQLPLGQWHEVEIAAMNLALFRLIKEKEGQFNSYPDFLSGSGFLFEKMTVHLGRAFLEIHARMETGEISEPSQCLNLLGYEEFSKQAD